MAKQSSIKPATVTKEALTFNVDYNDPTAAIVPSKATFCTQAAITQFLAAKGTSNFKYVQDCIDATPQEWQHKVTINLAAGVHRPKTVDLTLAAWDINKKLRGAGLLDISGPSPSAWPPVDGTLLNLVVDAYSNAGLEPYVDFSSSNPGIFTGKDVEGMWLILSTGQAAVISSHTNDRAYLNSMLSPVPVPGTTTATVAKPSAILRNSIDDSTTASWACVSLSLDDGHEDIYQWCKVWNIVLENEGDDASTIISINSPILAGFIDMSYVLFDAKTRGNHNLYGCIDVGGGLCEIVYCSGIGNVNSRTPITVGGGAWFWVLESYFRDFGRGIWLNSAGSFGCLGITLNNIPSILPGDLPATIYILNSGYDFFDWSYAKNKIKNVGAGRTGVYLDGASQIRRWGADTGGAPQGLYFENCAGPCVTIGNGVPLDHSKYPGTGYKDDGGNTNVGIALVGSNSTVRLATGTDVAGTLGAVRMADGDIWNYTDISAQGPITDISGNLVTKIP
jgi:hypothetical protein